MSAPVDANILGCRMADVNVRAYGFQLAGVASTG